MAGADVVVAQEASKTVRTATTGPQGEFRFLALTVTAKGFTHYLQQELRLLVNTPATANVQIKSGSTTENVTVTGETPVLTLVDTSIGNPFNEMQVKQIPMEGRKRS